jgi:hypothetical protein
LKCRETLDPSGQYGWHAACFSKHFESEPGLQFEGLSRTEGGSEPKSGAKSPPYLQSYFAGNYRKYDGRLGNVRYLLKFQDDTKSPELVAVEYLCNVLAQALKVPVPGPFGIIHIYDEPAFAVLNFVANAAHPKNLVHMYRYIGQNAFSVEVICETIMAQTQKLLDVECFLWVILFDALIGNHDRHGRNLALIETAKSKRLAPFYDNVSALGLESGEILKATWNPTGKISTCSSDEPGMKDYVAEVHRLGYGHVVSKFKKRAAQVNFKSVVLHSPLLSPLMKTAILNLIFARVEHLNA